MIQLLGYLYAKSISWSKSGQKLKWRYRSRFGTRKQCTFKSKFREGKL